MLFLPLSPWNALNYVMTFSYTNQIYVASFRSCNFSFAQISSWRVACGFEFCVVNWQMQNSLVKSFSSDPRLMAQHKSPQWIYAKAIQQSFEDKNVWCGPHVSFLHCGICFCLIRFMNMNSTSIAWNHSANIIAFYMRRMLNTMNPEINEVPME